MSSEGGKKLTKKEKKALAFRSAKGKNKSAALDEQDAVPVSEDVNEAERQPVDSAATQKALASNDKPGKKRKRDDDDPEQRDAPGGADAEGEGQDDAPKKKKRQRGKKKSQQIRPGGTDEEGKPRLIVFVGKSFLFVPP